MYLDDPGHRLYEKLMEAHFGNHPLSMSVLGLGRVDPEARARPDGRLLQAAATARATWCSSVTGRLDFDEVVRLAEKYCGDWPRVDAPREQPRPLYKPQRDRPDRREAQPPVHDGHDARPSAQDERRFAARVLADVIGDSDGSRLLLGAGRQRDRRRRRLRLLPARWLRLVLPRADHRRRCTSEIAPAQLERIKGDLNDAEGRTSQEQDCIIAGAFRESGPRRR